MPESQCVSQSKSYEFLRRAPVPSNDDVRNEPRALNRAALTVSFPQEPPRDRQPQRGTIGERDYALQCCAARGAAPDHRRPSPLSECARDYLGAGTRPPVDQYDHGQVWISSDVSIRPRPRAPCMELHVLVTEPAACVRYEAPVGKGGVEECRERSTCCTRAPRRCRSGSPASACAATARIAAA